MAFTSRIYRISVALVQQMEEWLKMLPKPARQEDLRAIHELFLEQIKAQATQTRQFRNHEEFKWEFKKEFDRMEPMSFALATSLQKDGEGQTEDLVSVGYVPNETDLTKIDFIYDDSGEKLIKIMVAEHRTSTALIPVPPELFGQLRELIRQISQQTDQASATKPDSDMPIQRRPSGLQ